MFYYIKILMSRPFYWFTEHIYYDLFTCFLFQISFRFHMKKPVWLDNKRSQELCLSS